MKISEIHADNVDIGRLVDDTESCLRDLTPEGFGAVRCVIDPSQISINIAPGGEWEPLGAFRRRPHEDQSKFNVAFIVPTGVGAATGGHAGDACPVLRLIASTADLVLTHPNVVNGSDLNEIPDNAWYIEGSALSRVLMGTIGLYPVRKNRVLVLLGSHPDEFLVDAAINAVNAARASFGLDCPEVIFFRDCHMRVDFHSSGRATGVVEEVGEIVRVLKEARGYDAIAISSRIDTGLSVQDGYYTGDGSCVNPWGGIEAILTHWLTSFTGRPSAHAPMMESREIDHQKFSVVDPRMAAEVISITYMECVLKGLMHAPRFTTDLSRPGLLTASHVSALVIPAGCFGLPVIAALRQGIPVIAVKDTIHSSTCLDLIRSLPWEEGQYIEASNYHEASGFLTELRAGLARDALRRPLKSVIVRGR